MRPLSLKEKYVSTLTSSHPSLLIASFSYIHALQVGCHAKDGIGTPCQNCIKANRACEWPLTPGQDPATIRRTLHQPHPRPWTDLAPTMLSCHLQRSPGLRPRATSPPLRLDGPFTCHLLRQSHLPSQRRRRLTPNQNHLRRLQALQRNVMVPKRRLMPTALLAGT